MKILIACEFSGIVRDAFTNAGHYSVSCDLLPSERPYGRHIEDDVLNHLDEGWDLMIAHPPCTHLTSTGARWFKYKRKEQEAALEFVWELLTAPIPKIALENPIGILSTRIRKPDQIIQPWWFGHGDVKATCLWLKGLPLLKPTNVVQGRNPASHLMPSNSTQWLNRSRTYKGIAQAMADQWG